MGKVRGKAKKLTAVGSNSSNVEQLPPYRKRGRPQKQIKEELDKEEITKINEEEEEDESDSELNSPTKDINATNENGKRKRSQSTVKVNVNSDAKVINSTEEELSKKKNGFRQTGSRRKNKPRRAAEAGFPVQMIDS